MRWTAAAAVAAMSLLVGNVASATATAATTGVSVPVEGPFSGPGELVNDPCLVPEQPPGTSPIGVAFDATGTLSLGESEVDGVLCLDPFVGGQHTFGPLTITTAKGTLTGDMEGTLVPETEGDLTGPSLFDMTATVTGGTGKFEDATGTLTLEGVFTLRSMVVEGTISGTITRPAHTPSSKGDCRHGGWRNFEDENGEPFTSQRDCVCWVKEHVS